MRPGQHDHELDAGADDGMAAQRSHRGMTVHSTRDDRALRAHRGMTVKSDASADLRQDVDVVKQSEGRSGTTAWASLVGDVGAVVGGVSFLVVLSGWWKLIAVGLILYGLIHGLLWIWAHRRR